MFRSHFWLFLSSNLSERKERYLWKLKEFCKLGNVNDEVRRLLARRMF